MEAIFVPALSSLASHCPDFYMICIGLTIKKGQNMTSIQKKWTVYCFNKLVVL